MSFFLATTPTSLLPITSSPRLEQFIHYLKLSCHPISQPRNKRTPPQLQVATYSCGVRHNVQAQFQQYLSIRYRQVSCSSILICQTLTPFTAASLVVLFLFDCTITLSQEIDVIWARKWTTTTWLYAIMRYSLAVDVIGCVMPVWTSEVGGVQRPQH